MEITISLIFMILGVLGAILPLLPGLVFSFLGLFLLVYQDVIELHPVWLIIIALWVVFLKIIDYLLPAYTTKKFGGSKYAIWGSSIGLIIGIIFSPLGFVSIIICPFLGAFIAEYIQRREMKNALKAALGSFAGFLLSNGLNLLTAIGLLAFAIYKLWDNPAFKALF